MPESRCRVDRSADRLRNGAQVFPDHCRAREKLPKVVLALALPGKRPRRDRYRRGANADFPMPQTRPQTRDDGGLGVADARSQKGYCLGAGRSVEECCIASTQFSVVRAQ